ncbi:hypothetical protein G8759_21715 [Spirosoma aureum]|uniref:Uncharacterized protein n=1 Tax=Spirosoma aureum TaxID=2692134 RepID=A0A6G9ARL0_9BACT|nr:hypothetical protein [Spirosoma aureum]QIP15050.1 hypothetical protein G8759_21715 [Spirosoma aureum]
MDTSKKIEKKVWVKPEVQQLNINKDTYSSQGNGTKEVGQGGGLIKIKTYPLKESKLAEIRLKF